LRRILSRDRYSIPYQMIGIATAFSTGDCQP
jgi:hypothetical protein